MVDVCVAKIDVCKRHYQSVSEDIYIYTYLHVQTAEKRGNVPFTLKISRLPSLCKNQHCTQDIM